MLALPTGLLAGEEIAAERQSPIVRAIARAEQAVVNIESSRAVPTETASYRDASSNQLVNGMGTGVVIDPRGYIVTNLHVVKDVSKIEVTLADGTLLTGRLLTSDSDTDLALIKVDPTRPLPTIPIGSSRDLMRGETVIAIGNPFGYRHTVTVGIISAMHRDVPVNGTQEYYDLIQTSADINPGNSGGPLLNIHGDMIGINVAVRVGAQGIGFAIPVDRAMDVMCDLVAAARTTGVEIGLACECSLEDGQCSIARVSHVVPDSPLAQLGVISGDKLVSVGGRKVKHPLDVELALLDQPVGRSIELQVERDQQLLTHQVSLVPARKNHRQEEIAAAAWQSIGLRLAPASKDALRTFGSEYQGGLRIVDVRPGSTASRNGLKSGDILVGVMQWKTPNLDDLGWILANPEFKQARQAKFFVVRGQQLFYSALQASDRVVR